ncbi:hypothetical protein AAZX31_13G205100 [Glycine max]|uniref:Protein BPS1, chloroplastic n=1 Tax=Glycine soja TaxID=3848 RepID=A0A445I8G4_GLYSO|nr:uncharacterized protein LOC114374641 isoform X1 [Glycine soja]KAG4971321.1 hypothetical protein JHK85_037742 [Glycine max]KAG4977718.1 hypothetical protein JHK86_037192 [Glycine max]KAG5113716.1 hypothetical protein JHK82_036985 [Glycine max]KAG5130994.1 hypothetical protein JHK84_037391 [Glycine max]KAH1102796.1 hypothetical protein GYH30_037029 [Glycine max]
MATVRSNSITVFFVAFIILTTAPSPSQSLSFSSYFRYRNLFSLSHSLLIGVANLRAARGDVAGADRARSIADGLDQGTVFGFLKLLWTLSWTDMSFTDLYGAVSDMNELLRGLTELTRLESVAERSAWVSRNYQSVLTVFKSLSRKLLKALGQSGVMREIGETFQKEVVEGGLIRDCLELGNNDLKALIQIVKDLLLQFFPVRDKDHDL